MRTLVTKHPEQNTEMTLGSCKADVFTYQDWHLHILDRRRYASRVRSSVSMYHSYHDEGEYDEDWMEEYGRVTSNSLQHEERCFHRFQSFFFGRPSTDRTPTREDSDPRSTMHWSSAPPRRIRLLNYNHSNSPPKEFVDEVSAVYYRWKEKHDIRTWHFTVSLCDSPGSQRLLLAWKLNLPIKSLALSDEMCEIEHELTTQTSLSWLTREWIR